MCDLVLEGPVVFKGAAGLRKGIAASWDVQGYGPFF